MEPNFRKRNILKEMVQSPTEKPSEQNDESFNGRSITNVASITENNVTKSWFTNNRFTFCVLLFARLSGAIWNPLPDCGETYNFWEPLHYLLFGSGMQTWEFSPAYAIHSYAYVLVYAFPAWIIKLLFPTNKVIIFYFVRVLLVFASVSSELYFYKGVSKQFGPKIAKITFVFLLFSAGMFQSSSALLANSFSMYMCLIFFGAWYQRQYALAIVATATSTLFSWPYAGLIGVGLAIDMLLIKKKWQMFLKWCLISVATVLVSIFYIDGMVPMVSIDSYFYGRLVIARLNAVLYNVFTDHGPNLFGVSPWTFYFFNGFLNFNLLFPFALVSLPAILLTNKLKPFGNHHGSLIWTTLLPFYLWILIFFSQPHKEERFLFPIYPLFGLAAAISLTCVETIFISVKFSRRFSGFLTIGLLVISSFISVSRIIALHKGFHAPIDIFLQINHLSKSDNGKNIVGPNICIGKQWFEFPSSFFLPDKMKLLYLPSVSTRQLPSHFYPPPNGTRIIPPNVNDLNMDEPSRYSSLKDCHYLVELVVGKSTERNPPYHLMTDEWEIIFKIDYLDVLESPKGLRSFYIPGISDKYWKKVPYVLLQRRQNGK